MKKTIIIFIAFLLSFTLVGCSDGNGFDPEKPTVAVSVVPQAAFVEAVAGDLVNVITLIPAGQSPATYDPDAKTMTELQDADVYFAIGVPTEEGNILPEIPDLNKVNLHDVVDAVYAPRMFSETSRDPHIWLSIKRVKIMVEAIADELIKIDSDNQAVYEENRDSYLAMLDGADAYISELFATKTEMTSFIIYHPSFGYFADDYNLDMRSIEEDGKVASIDGLTSVIDFAVDNQIEYVFYQSEFDVSQVAALEEEIEGFQAVQLIPLSDNYIQNMIIMANRISEALR